MSKPAAAITTTTITIRDHVHWRGVTYPCNTVDEFNADGNLIKRPVATKVEVPVELAEVLKSSGLAS